jgi:hypothetical protein
VDVAAELAEVEGFGLTLLSFQLNPYKATQHRHQNGGGKADQQISGKGQAIPGAEVRLGKE